MAAMMPPSRCCTVLRLPSGLTTPGATAALASGTHQAQVPAAAEEEGDDRPADEPLPAREGAERGAVPGGREHRRGAGAHGAAPVAPAAGIAPAACGRPAIGTTLRREPSTVSTSSRGPAWTTSPARR